MNDLDDFRPTKEEDQQVHTRLKGVEIVFASTFAPPVTTTEPPTASLVDDVVKFVTDKLGAKEEEKRNDTATTGLAENRTVDLGIFGSFWLQTARPIKAAEDEIETTQRPEPVFNIDDYVESK